MLFLQWHIFHDVRITFFCGMFELCMEITWKLRFVFVRHCDVFLLRYNYVIYLFDVVTFELRLEITLQLRYVFARHCDVISLRHNDVVLLHHNYFIYLFVVVTIFDDVRITLYFGTFELRMEMTWQLRFIFVHHCDEVFITLQLRYLFVRCIYVFQWR